MIGRDLSHFREADAEMHMEMDASIDGVMQQPIPSEEASAPKIEPSLAEKHGDIAPPTYCEATTDSTLAKD